MKPSAFYNLAYSVLGDSTPLSGDCGRACGKACCEGDKDGDGMYLFPYEDALYRQSCHSERSEESSFPHSCNDWFSISETDFEYSKDKFAPLFACDGVCNRNLRPLSCRIFPLTPYITENGDLKVIVDPRANGMCPLSALLLSDFDPVFVKRVENVGKLLIKNSETREFLTTFSRMLDETTFI